MTSADGFVLKLLEDNSIVAPELIQETRKVAEKSAEAGKGIDTETLERLIHDKHCTEGQVLELLAEEFHTETVDMDKINISPEAIEKVDKELVLKYGVFPLFIDASNLQLVSSDPFDTDAVDDLSRLLNLSVDIKIASPQAIQKAIEAYYKEDADQGDERSDIFDEMLADEASQAESQKTESEEDKAPIIRYVRKIITDAIDSRTSDIHIEPMDRKFRIRYRIDGQLQEMPNPPKRLQAPIIARLKLMANLKLAERRLPQDGRIQVRTPKKDVDLRVSLVPTVHGESIVMRILDKESLNLGLAQLGFLTDDQEKFEHIITLPDGIFLVTGPTGSGKSTTLYSALNYINKPNRKIITVEDPVEYQMNHINQVQVNATVNMTFSAALRAMLRQSPNVILVGEIRDLETAEIAINAALTGHLVFSTLHTNDAPGAIARLVDIGIKPFLISAALRGVLAQRLVRRLCPSCGEPGEADPKEIAPFKVPESRLKDLEFYQSVGCAKCNNIGFKGRVGIFEFFLIDEEIQHLIYQSDKNISLREKARAAGMLTMREDGFRKATTGMTTLQEVLKVTIGDAD